jgi:hypothetical protein
MFPLPSLLLLLLLPRASIKMQPLLPIVSI